MSTSPSPAASGPQSALRVGPAGFSYPDWNGRVYPAGTPAGFDPLAWLARFFPLIEINASFYRIPAARTSAAWIPRVRHNPAFRFTAKLHGSFTHERVLEPAAVAAFLEFAAPLREAALLGPLLAQFPWSFRPNAAALDWLARLGEAFTGHALAVEVRHGDWAQPSIQEQVAARGLHLVSIDQPQIGRSLPPVAMLASSIAYVRLHGRNHAAWFAADAGRDARYDYLYSTAELTEWAQRTAGLAARARETYVVTNNHFEGKAVANAFELQALLGQPVPAVPRALWERHGQLAAALAARGQHPVLVDAPGLPADGEAGQGSLFG